MAKIKGDINEFKEGRLVYACLRRYQGRGPVTLILHEAQPTECGAGYGYGHGKHWTINPATLMGAARSEAKARASRRNGKKGGRPIGPRDFSEVIPR